MFIVIADDDVAIVGFFGSAAIVFLLKMIKSVLQMLSEV